MSRATKLLVSLVWLQPYLLWMCEHKFFSSNLSLRIVCKLLRSVCALREYNLLQFLRNNKSIMVMEMTKIHGNYEI